MRSGPFAQPELPYREVIVRDLASEVVAKVADRCLSAQQSRSGVVVLWSARKRKPQSAMVPRLAVALLRVEFEHFGGRDYGRARELNELAA